MHYFKNGIKKQVLISGLILVFLAIISTGCFDIFGNKIPKANPIQKSVTSEHHLTNTNDIDLVVYLIDSLIVDVQREMVNVRLIGDGLETIKKDQNYIRTVDGATYVTILDKLKELRFVFEEEVKNSIKAID